MSLYAILFLIISIITCQESRTDGLPALNQQYSVPKHTTSTRLVPLNQFLPYGRGESTFIEKLPTTADGVTKIRKTLPNGNYIQCEYGVTNVTPRDGSAPFHGEQYSCTECNLVYCNNPNNYSGSLNQQKNQKHDQYDKAKNTYTQLASEAAAQPASVLEAVEQNTRDALNIRFTAMTWNCYAFPKESTEALKGNVPRFLGVNRDLQEGVLDPVDVRIPKQAQVVKNAHPDIVCFQELWKNDNKDQMVNALKDEYPFNYFVPFSSGEEAKQTIKQIGKTLETIFTHPSDLKEEGQAIFRVDSGLLIMSKLRILKQDYITYDDKGGDEKAANKGALVIWFKDRKGNDTLLATTHLQSWTDIPYITIRRNQLRQLGKFMSYLAKEWKLVNPTFVVMGDLNDPITLKSEWVERCHPCCDLRADDCKKNICGVTTPGTLKVSQECKSICNLSKQFSVSEPEPRRLVDRTSYMVKALQDNGIPVTYDEVLNLLKKKYTPQEHLDVQEIEQQIIVRSPTGQILRTVTKNSTKDPLHPFMWEIETGEFIGFRLCMRGVGGWVEWENSSVRDHIQLIDHVFIDSKLKLLDYRILKKEAFGNTPKAQDQGWDSSVAISDHAPVFVILGNR